VSEKNDVCFFFAMISDGPSKIFQAPGSGVKTALIFQSLSVGLTIGIS
jgi:hypothetical protein